MDKPLFIILGSQLLFTTSDLLARHNMQMHVILKEQLSLQIYLGIMLAVLAVIIVGFSK